VIVIEGPDGAGKSTLVEKLKEHFQLSVGKRGTTNRDELYKVTVPDTFRAFEGAFHGPATLWDRLYFSELVYYTYTTGKCAFSKMQQEFFERMFVAVGAPVILCLPPEQTVVDIVQKPDRHEMLGVELNIRHIYRGYEDLMRLGVLPPQTHVYDFTTRRGLDEVLFMVDEYINRKKELLP
jgi:hypothetical protein